MPVDERLADAVRFALADAPNVREQKMFGGIGFMVNGNLLAGASTRGLLLRIGKAQVPKALTKPGARPLVMRGRTMADYVYIDAPVNSRSVKAWITLALRYVEALPPKSASRPIRRRRR